MNKKLSKLGPACCIASEQVFIWTYYEKYYTRPINAKSAALATALYSRYRTGTYLFYRVLVACKLRIRLDTIHLLYCNKQCFGFLTFW